MQILKRLLPYFIIIVLSGISILYLYPGYHPFAGIRFYNQEKEIRYRAQAIADHLGLGVDKQDLVLELNQNRNLIIQAHYELGIRKGSRLIREQIPGYYFVARWEPDDSPVVINADTEDRRHRPAPPFKTTIEMKFDLKGNLLGMEYELPDSMTTAALPAEEAKATALNFLRKFTAFDFYAEDSARFRAIEKHNEIVTNTETNRPFSLEQKVAHQGIQRKDYEFVWKSRLPVLQNKMTISADVTGSMITRLRIDYGIPEAYTPTRGILSQGIWMIISFLFFVITILILAVRRIRSYEISFQMAVVLGILVALSNALEIYSLFSGEMHWELLLPLVLVPLFTGGAFIILWAVSESLGREVWNDKYYTLDLLKGRFLRQSDIGMSLIRGIAFGMLMLGVSLILTYAMDSVFKVATVFTDKDNLQPFNAYFPAVNETVRNFYHAAYIVTPFLLFTLSFLRKKIYSRQLLILAGTVIMGITLNNRIEPFHVGLLVMLLSTVIMVWAFCRYDVLTAFFIMFMFLMTDTGLGLFYVDATDMRLSGWYLLAGLVITLIYALYTVFSRDSVVNPQMLRPAFVEHITERERMQRELEIARGVQMDFLPQSLPRIAGLDLAARCYPALEVGGDYYDFIELGKNRLGVVIGDVSGKGTQAAFFMTLTKGLVKALAREDLTPAEVLRRVNRLFYENARRNTFISMVYAIFDLDQRQVTIARAGHNPVIMHSSQEGAIDTVQSEGLALGLDPGPRFNERIQEKQIPVEKGDIFVFYTDGLTEARNRSQEEYGEDRLIEIIRKEANATSSELLKKVFIETRRFVGRAEQHDDMTLIVVKVL